MNNDEGQKESPIITFTKLIHARRRVTDPEQANAIEEQMKALIREHKQVKKKSSLAFVKNAEALFKIELLRERNQGDQKQDKDIQR